jgi:TolB-like protein
MHRRMYAALLLVGFAWGLRADAIVALPFSNQSNDRNLNWIGESIAETVLETAHGQGMVVLDRGDRAAALQRLSLKPYVTLSRASIVKLGDELDASHIVYGSFEIQSPEAGSPVAGEAAKPSLRIRAWVLDLKQLRQSDEILAEGLLEDLAALQSGIARRIVKNVDPARWPDSEPGAPGPRIRLDAIENYIR